MSSYTTTKADGEVKIRVGSSGIAALEPTTVIAQFKKTVEANGTKPAYKTMKKGETEWTPTTWTEYYAKCRSFGKSLLHLGVEPYKAVNIIGFNSPEWFIANCGAILAQVLSAGIYTTNNPASCKYVSEHSQAAVVVVDGVAQLSKYTNIARELPNLKALVIYNDVKPVDFDCGVPLYTFDEFMALGADVADKALDKRMAAQKPANCCTLIYTSGTTGNPKAVMISHDNITWTCATTIDRVSGVDSTDRQISYLPLSHVAAQLLDIHAPIASGMCVYFAQPDALKGSLGTTLKAVRPTIFFGVPRVWEKIAEKMQALGAQTTGVKKMIATWCKEKGLAKTRMAQYGASGGVPCGFTIADRVVLSKIKAALGLDAARHCLTGAAPITHETLEYFGSLDIPICELFGQSECTGPQTICVAGAWKLGTTGRALDGTEMKIVDGSNELIYRGRNVMMGYLNNEEQTASTIDEEAYLHSGDCAKIDEDGFMSITGRIKELIITAGGENVPPVLIEDKIKEHCKAISNVMVVGDKRKFLAALLCLRVIMDADGNPTPQLDPMALDVAKEIGSTATTVEEARNCDKFKTYFDQSIKAANKEAVSRAQNVNKWHLLTTDFSVRGGELTPTLKLKRRIVVDKYNDVIEEMYNV